MPGHRGRSHRKERSSSCSSRSKSSDSCSDRKEKKGSRRCRRSESNDRSRSRSRSRSSSCSRSEIECFTNDKEMKHHKDGKHHKRRSSSSSSSSSSSDSEHKFNFQELYQYFKNRLIEDNHLMVAGSNAYINSVSDTQQVIPRDYPVNINNVTLAYNIELPVLDAPFFVRESGIYVLFFVINTDNSAQFTVFVNGVANMYTTIGTNSGAGQVVSRHLLRLNKDDNVLIRNYESSSTTVKSQLYSGGLNPGVDMTILMAKIAPLHTPEKDCEKARCLSKKKKFLFKKLTKKLYWDKELMIRGFDIMGTFFTKDTQMVNTESDVKFDSQQNVHGLLWNPTGSNPEQVKILEDGVYKLFFMTNTNTAGQFAVSVNGVPVETTTQGTSKGANQMSIRAILELKQNDIISIKNHTSANGSVIISEHAGGKYKNISAILNMFKIAPLVKPVIKPVDCKVVKKFECYYELFRNYLLCKDYLQITGSPAYLSVTDSTHQAIAVNEPINWSTLVHKHDVGFTQGKNYFVVEKSGVYDIFADVIADEPIQYAMFVNGVPNDTTIFGRDSGANRCLMRQFIKLSRGDVITLRNYESNGGTVNIAVNPGGELPGQSIQFMAFLLRQSCDKPHDFTEEEPKPPVKPMAKEEKKPKK